MLFLHVHYKQGFVALSWRHSCWEHHAVLFCPVWWWKPNKGYEDIETYECTNDMLLNVYETTIVCPCLFLAIQLYWNFKLYCSYFFPKSAFPIWGCGLSKNAAYTQTITVHLKSFHQFPPNTSQVSRTTYSHRVISITR